MEKNPLFEMEAVIHVDTTELDVAIEKTNQLLATLTELQEKTDLLSGRN